MPHTDRLHSDLNLKRLEVGQIVKDCQSLAKSIEQLLADFCDRYGADIDDTWPGINDALSDMLDSATKPKLRDIEDLERRISDAERADLRRSSPVCI